MRAGWREKKSFLTKQKKMNKSDDDDAVRIVALRALCILTALTTLLEGIGADTIFNLPCVEKISSDVDPIALVAPGLWLLARSSVTGFTVLLLLVWAKCCAPHYRAPLMVTTVVFYVVWTFVWEFVGFALVSSAGNNCVSRYLHSVLLLSLYAGLAAPISISFSVLLFLQGQSLWQ
jgi:hypothetical protein